MICMMNSGTGLISKKGMPRWVRVKGTITEEEVKKAYSRATDSMSRLNRSVNTLN